MADELTPITAIREIWLGGRPYQLAADLSGELGNLMGRPVNQGDPGPNDHPNYTTSIQRDWSGGALVKKMNPASDTGRFRWSTMETQYPGSISLAPMTDEVNPPDGHEGTPWILGDFQDRLYIAWGTHVYWYNALDGSFHFVSEAPSSPTGAGTVYREYSDLSAHKLVMFVPSAAGYFTIDEDGVIEDGTNTLAATGFAVWDLKIFKLDSDGILYYATYRPEDADHWELVTAVPDGTTPRRLVRFMDRSNNPTLMVITDGSTFKLDFANAMLHTDDLDFPRHPHQGRAAVNHKGELFVSVGTGIHRYDNNTISAMGLDSRDGLPPEFRGFIKDMLSTYNGLYALVQGETIQPAQPIQGATMNLGGGDDQLYMSQYQTHNLLMVYNGFGWHYRWHGSGTAPSNIEVSNAQNTYALWWGANGKLYRQELQRIYFNPGDLETRGYRFTGTGEHTSSWNDYNWVDQPKIMKAIAVKTKGMTGNSRVDVYYKLDDDTNPWTLAKSITTNGKHRIWLGLDQSLPQLKVTEPFKPTNAAYKGVRHTQYALRFVVTRDTNDIASSPVIEWHTVVARRWLRPQRNWRAQLDLTDKTKDWTIEDQINHLVDLAARQEGVLFQFGRHQVMAELAVVRYSQKGGRDGRMLADITLLESQDLDAPE